MQPGLKIVTFFCFFMFKNGYAQDSIKQNTVSIKYDLTSFHKSEHKPWHLLSLEYTRYIKNMPLAARINYANRFATSGVQFEADAYPAISKKIYTYVNAGYSKDVLLFPKYRGGASLYISLPAAFEAEGGFRILYFSSATWIYTAALGKYYKNYWFNLSTFLTPGSNLHSYFAKCRYYINDKDYVMLLVGTGISPDDRNNNIQLNLVNKFSNTRAELSLRKTFFATNILLFNVGVMKQEYEPKKYSGQFNAGIGFQKIF